MSLAPAATPEALANPERPLRRSVARQAPGRVVLAQPPSAASPSGVYLLRGGLAWPRSVKGEGIQGYGVVCGRHEATGRVTVFEEAPFVTIDWLEGGADPGGLQTQYPPVAALLDLAWHHYLCREFYWRDRRRLRGEEATVYPREIAACPAVAPKPLLLRLEWQDEDQALTRVFIRDVQAQLAYRPEGGIHRALRWQQAAGEGAALHPALEALASALAGLGRLPREGGTR